MSTLTEPLKAAGQNGLDVICGDGRLRKVYPIFMSFVGDYPE